MSSRICGNSNQPRAHSWELLIKKKKNEIASLVLFQDQVSKDDQCEKEEHGVFSKR